MELVPTASLRYWHTFECYRTCSSLFFLLLFCLPETLSRIIFEADAVKVMKHKSNGELVIVARLLNLSKAKKRARTIPILALVCQTEPVTENTKRKR